MQYALKGVPVAQPTVPPGVTNVSGEWYYDEYARGAGVTSLADNTAPGSAAVGDDTPERPSAEERSHILDLFRR